MHHARLSRKLIHGFLLAIAAGVVGLAGCTMVSDSLTGVALDKAGPTTCVKQCNDFYKLAYEEEQKAHLANLEACQALLQPDKNDCLNAESIRHSAAKDALTSAKIECQNNCRQGRGSAG